MTRYGILRGDKPPPETTPVIGPVRASKRLTLTVGGHDLEVGPTVTSTYAPATYATNTGDQATITVTGPGQGLISRAAIMLREQALRLGVGPVTSTQSQDIYLSVDGRDTYSLTEILAVILSHVPGESHDRSELIHRANGTFNLTAGLSGNVAVYSGGNGGSETGSTGSGVVPT